MCSKQRLGCKNPEIDPITWLLAPGTPWKYQIYNHYRLTWTLPPWCRNVTQYSAKLLLILNTFDLQFKRSSNQCSPSRQPSVWITRLQYNLIDLIQQKRSSGFEQLQQLTASPRVSIAGYIFPFIGPSRLPSVAQWLPIVPLWFAVFIQGSIVLPTCLSGREMCSSLQNTRLTYS